MSISEYKEKICDCICEHYHDIAAIDGADLHELGEWIDIVKDISEIEYYESKSKTMDSIIHELSEMIDMKKGSMPRDHIDKYRTELQNLVNKMA